MHSRYLAVSFSKELRQATLAQVWGRRMGYLSCNPTLNKDFYLEENLSGLPGALGGQPSSLGLSTVMHKVCSLSTAMHNVCSLFSPGAGSNSTTKRKKDITHILYAIYKNKRIWHIHICIILYYITTHLSFRYNSLTLRVQDHSSGFLDKSGISRNYHIIQILAKYSYPVRLKVPYGTTVNQLELLQSCSKTWLSFYKFKITR